jgi:hypothetical protein
MSITPALRTVILAGFAASLTTTATARAQNQAVPDSVRACVVPGTGTIYRIGASGGCLATTHTLLTWSTRGPAGVAGPAGPTGAAGPAGPPGPSGASALPCNGCITTPSIADGNVTDAKLATITAPGKVANSATTATSAISAGTIVARDETGSIGALNIQIAGSINAAAGLRAVALGTNATATSGSFIFADASGPAIATSGEGNMFLVRASGGARFQSSPDGSTGVVLLGGSGAWESVSNVRAKTEFRAEDPERFLRGIAGMSIGSWRYRAQDASIRHVGPTAQDFRAAFGIGASDSTINVVDADGVNMLAIQALERRGAALRAENDSLSARVNQMEKRLTQLEALLRTAPARKD